MEDIMMMMEDIIVMMEDLVMIIEDFMMMMMEEIIMMVEDLVMIIEDWMEDIILVFFTTERWPDGREQNTWGPPYKLANNGNIRYICKYACDTKVRLSLGFGNIW